VVLYAPTWEGAQPSVAYSSVLTHGERLVDALLADPRFTVVYRPHPLVGVNNRRYAVADHGMRAAIARAAEADPGAGHRVVEAGDEDLEASFQRAHLLICDISAVATAWLPSLKPMIVSQPAGSDAVSADSGMLRVVPRLAVADIPGLAALVHRELDEDPTRRQREELVAYYLSPYWPDGVLERFVAVCGELIAERNELRGRLVAAGATGT
jgi:CDP-glycerol glycerophosphotransferase (TagB/SpsB family)